MKVAFVHPDLGIGGAERLVVDAALAMQNLGHEVTIYTSHHDRGHCFDETRDGTLRVVVLGNGLFPRNIAGKLAILCAIARQLHLAKQLVARGIKPDLFIVDQLSAAIPYLRVALPASRFLFYCHHPDLLLTERKSLAKKAYRLPFDIYEKWSTSLADHVVVNSEYTLQVYNRTFGSGMPPPAVVYPVVDTNAPKTVPEPIFEIFKGKILLSINRFERKKNMELALEAYALLLHLVPQSRDSLLIFAGGYDVRVQENLEYLAELMQLASKFRLPATTVYPGESLHKIDFEKTRVLFLPSVPTDLKNYLLERSSALLYTPTNEHFGIVPLEAMRVGTPVLATNTGGPLETVEDGVNGWLRPSDTEEWYRVIRHIIIDATPEQLAAMGAAGKKTVQEHFSIVQLEQSLNKVSKLTMATPRVDESSVVFRIYAVGIVLCLLLLFSPLILYLLLQGARHVLHIIVPLLVESTQW